MFKNFKVKDYQDIKEIEVGFEEGLKKLQEHIGKAKDAETLKKQDTLMRDFLGLAEIASILGTSASSDEIKETARDYEKKIIQVYDKFYVEAPIPSDADEYIRERLMKKKQATGAMLKTADETKRLDELKAELLDLQNTFSENVQDALEPIEFSILDLKEWGMPDTEINSRLKKGDDKVAVFTVARSDYVPFMKYVSNRDARYKMYAHKQDQAWDTNTPLIERAREVFSEITELLGFDDIPQYHMHNNLLARADELTQWMGVLFEKIESEVEQEYEMLSAHVPYEKLEVWDAAYAAKIAKEKLGFDSGKVDAHITWSTALDALFSGGLDFFGLHAQKVQSINLWHQDVEVYSVFQSDEKLGYLVFDPFGREDGSKKYNHFACWMGIWEDDLPVAVTIGNWARTGPIGTDGIKTLFHEVGHGLSWLLSKAPFCDLFYENDLVEIPSMMLEDMGISHNTREYLKDSDGNSLTEAEVEKYIEVKDLTKALYISRGLELSNIALSIYREPDRDLLDIVRSVYESEYNPFDYHPEMKFLGSFGHLLSDLYGSAYYVYMYSFVFADAIATKASQKNWDPNYGTKIRTQLFEKAGVENLADELESLTR